MRPYYHGMVAALAVMGGGLADMGSKLRPARKHRHIHPLVVVIGGCLMGALMGVLTVSVHIPWISAVVFGKETQLSVQLS
ncbi:MAG: hypothetical protein AB8B47_00545 [Roseobacter sp.]